MEDYIARTIKAYDDTETYEKNTRSVVPKLELEQFVSMLNAGAVVLDAGCAYGRDTEYLATKGVAVSGVDLSPALIARAKELLPDTTFAVCDIRETNFSNATFDGIWCNATLLHLNDEDMAKALQEFKRILKPSGVLAVSLKKGEGTRQFVEKLTSNSERFFNYKTHETFLELLTKTGYTEIAWHYLNERERYGEDKRDLDWLYSFSKKIA
jgi:SAM-dependent methyltransferase